MQTVPDNTYRETDLKAMNNSSLFDIERSTGSIGFSAQQHLVSIGPGNIIMYSPTVDDSYYLDSISKWSL